MQSMKTVQNDSSVRISMSNILLITMVIQTNQLNREVNDNMTLVPDGLSH